MSVLLAMGKAFLLMSSITLALILVGLLILFSPVAFFVLLGLGFFLLLTLAFYGAPPKRKRR